VAVLLAALLQAVVVAQWPVIAKDGITFIDFAKELTRYPVATLREHDQHPGYPITVLFGHWCVRTFITSHEVLSWVYGARLVCGLCGVLGVIGVWLLSKRLFSVRVAGVAALIFAAMPLFRHNAADALSDAPQILFYVLGAWMAAEAFVRWRYRWFLGAGLASGVAYLTRPEGLTVAAAAAALLVWGLLRKWRPERRVLLLSLTTLLAATAVVAVPYVILAGKLTGKKDYRKLLSEGAWGEEPDWGKPPDDKKPAKNPGEKPSAPRPPEERGTGNPGNKPPAPESPKGRSTAKPDEGPAEEASSSAFTIFTDGVAALVRELVYGLEYPLLLPLLLGLLAPGRRKPQGPPRLVVSAMAATYTALLLGLYVLDRYLDHRHLMPLVILAVPWVGSGTIYLAEKIGSALARGSQEAARRRTAVTLAILVLVLLATGGRRSLRPLHKRHIPAVEAALWIGARKIPGDRILTNSYYVRFFANLPGLPVARLNRLRKVTYTYGAASYSYIVWWTRDETIEPKVYEIIKEFYDRAKTFELRGTRNKAYVYEVRKRGG